jgi:hypothetical protein
MGAGGPGPPSLTPHSEAAGSYFLGLRAGVAAKLSYPGGVTVEKPTREKRRRPAVAKAEERSRSAIQPVAPVDADERRRARERAGGDD